MSIFTQKVSTESLERMMENIGGLLQDINKNWELLCTHTKAVRESKGEITDWESTAKKKHDQKIPLILDNQKMMLEGVIYQCSECGKKFFVPTQALAGKTEEQRFRAFSVTYLNVMKMFKGLTYAETTVRGLYSGEISLDLPANIRGKIGKEYLFELAGMKINNQGGVPRSDRTAQLDRSMFLAHLEAKMEIYRAITKFFDGKKSSMDTDDIDLGAFGTGVDDNTFAPYRQDIPNNNINPERRSRYVDMVSRPRQEVNTRTKKKGTKKKTKDKGGMKKNV